MLINRVLFQYVSKFSTKYSTVLAWPTIKLDDRSFNPILNWREISTRKSMGEELTQLPKVKGLILEQEIDSDLPDYSAVNSHGDIIVGEDPGNIKIINQTGENKVGKVVEQCISCISVDKNNNVYVVRWVRTSTEKGYVKSSVLTVLDENYNVKQDSRRLEFLGTSNNVKIAINKNNNIIMMNFLDSQVYVLDNTGELKHKFQPGLRYPRSMDISGQDEIMVTFYYDQVVKIYSEEGNLKSIIKLPEGHVVLGLAFHYVICKIIVLTYLEKKYSYFLLYYTEAGELESTTFFGKRIRGEYTPCIYSNPSEVVLLLL
ncbi:Hypothetical predicted protein [Paramuricea clavata]|uniref:Uncharacterized protein n=1 Tax=Paramuricea clavata TaxID=317549 RepID=A0A6S7G146_PARCT|nr:Hypothetical predicted protein [Paramuricea clavata]